MYSYLYRCILLFILFFLPLCCFSQQPKIDSLTIVLRTAQEDTHKINALNTLSRELLKSGNYDTALLYAERAKKLAESVRFKKGTADAYHQIGSACYIQGNYPGALKNHFTALNIREKTGDQKGIADSYNSIGNVYYNQGNYPEALKNHFASLKIKEKIGDQKLISDSYNNIGIVYYSQGNYSEALENHVASLEIKEKIGDKKGLASSYNNIGIIYNQKGQYPQALKNLDAALKMAEEIHDLRVITAAYSNIGSVYDNLKNYPEALKNHFASLKIAEKTSDKRSTAAAYCNIGGIFKTQKKYKEGEEYEIKALSLSRETGDKDIIKSSYQILAEIDSAMGNIASGGGNWEQAGKYFNNAYINYKLYTVYKDSLLNEENTQKTVQTQMQYEFDKKEGILKEQQEKERALAEERSRKQNIITWSVAGSLLLVLMLSGFVLRSLRITYKQKQVIETKNKETEQQKQIIEEKNKGITDSINYARRIQQALLPPDRLLDKNPGDYFVLFQPKDIVSGDFYWATEKDNKFYLAACDSTGHGVPGAFMSLLNASFLNEAINEGIVQPNEVLNHVRKRLIENFYSEGGKDGMDGVLVCFDKNKGELYYSAAHNAPVIVLNGTLTKLYADNMPVGPADRLDSFKHETLHPKPGSILYMYTDGFADQFGGSKGKKFKYKKLNDLLLTNSDKPMKEQKNILEKTFEDWKGNLEQVDDILVIGIRIC